MSMISNEDASRKRTPVKPLKSKKLNASGEPLRRYHEAVALIRRLIAASRRHHYEDGEILSDVVYEADQWVEFETLEGEIFEQAVVPVSKRATGRTIADLTGIEHVCEFQNQIKPQDKDPA